MPSLYVRFCFLTFRAVINIRFSFLKVWRKICHYVLAKWILLPCQCPAWTLWLLLLWYNYNYLWYMYGATAWKARQSTTLTSDPYVSLERKPHDGFLNGPICLQDHTWSWRWAMSSPMLTFATLDTSSQHSVHQRGIMPSQTILLSNL